MTYEAIQLGLDTIKIASCLIGIEGKDCNEFTDDSINFDYQFFINVD